MTKQNTESESTLNTRLSNGMKMVTSVDLLNTGTAPDPVFHFLYASQAYATLFAVYGRFNYTLVGGRCRIDSIDLDLFNYSGIFNIGFIDEDPVYRNNTTEDFVLFGVRAMSTKRYARVSFRPADTGLPEFFVDKNTPRQLIFDRHLYKMLGFDNTNMDITDPANGKLKLNIPETPYFDDEFYNRSGADYYRHGLREGQSETALRNIVIPRASRVASPRCTQSIVNLIYR